MEGLRRIERVNDLVHRPLTGLADGLATSAGDPAASRLWEQYRRQIARGIGRLRVGLPQAGFMQRDPFALRVLLGLVLLTAVVGGWRDAPERRSEERRGGEGGRAGRAPATAKRRA